MSAELILANPISWKRGLVNDSVEQKVLKNLQGNILKGHGRNFTTNIFFNFGDKTFSKALLKKLGNEYITDALTQFQDIQAYKKNQCGNNPFYHIALSFAGYQALELDGVAPQGNFFREGMKGQTSIDAINDNKNDWEDEFKDNDIHALLIVAHDDEDTKDTLTKKIIGILKNSGCTIIKEQKGKVLKNEFKEGIEHFGYVDGRSQPLLLTEEIDQESMFNWNAEFPLKTALLQDIGAIEQQEFSFGSFLIFRKLEQNVRDFKIEEQKIANDLNLLGHDRELAGAMLVGRFEDGTPVTLSKRAFNTVPVMNDFNYDDDNGMRCPIHAHIRKTNPRGTGGVPEREVLFVRRGITYEDVARKTHPDEFPEVEIDLPTDDIDSIEKYKIDYIREFEQISQQYLPTGDVGLLFMGYNSNIEGQFQVMQRFWANNNDFPQANTGIDPVIASQGIRPSPNSQQLPNKWDNSGAGTTSCPFSGFVTMKGGEYFFSPSMTFLRSHH